MELEKYVEGRVRSVIDKHEIKGKIAVALSGGKDSAVCFYILDKFGLEVVPFHINLGIEGYSKECYEKSLALCKKLGYELEVVEGMKVNSCSMCGTVKRYIMNKFAYERGCDYLATGHNLSDLITFAFNNLASVNILNFRGMKPLLEGKPEYKMVAKIRPLYYLKDEECRAYANIKRIPYAEGKCPLARQAPTVKIKEWLHELEREKPGILLNFLKSFSKIEDKMRKEGKPNICKVCGYPAYHDVCKFCKLKSRKKN